MAAEYLEAEDYYKEPAPKALTKVQDLYHPHISLPNPNSFPRFNPSIKVDQRITDSVRRLGGDSLVLAYGYGSSFTGESKDGRFDFILITSDPDFFYQELISKRPQDFGSKSVERNVQLNQNGFNYYRTNLEIGDKTHYIKYAVAPFEVFLNHNLGLDQEGNPSVPRGKQIALAGRFQKGVEPLYESEDFQDQADIAINHSRIAGSWLALGMLPEFFDLTQFSETKINESYHADVRLEKWNKHKIIRAHSVEDYLIMDYMLLKKMVEAGIVERIYDEFYQSHYRPSRGQILNWVLEGKAQALQTNFGKNIITGKPLDSLGYGVQKSTRALTHGILEASKSISGLFS